MIILFPISQASVCNYRIGAIYGQVIYIIFIFYKSHQLDPHIFCKVFNAAMIADRLEEEKYI